MVVIDTAYGYGATLLYGFVPVHILSEFLFVVRRKNFPINGYPHSLPLILAHYFNVPTTAP
jgi:hypothetical protein